MIRKAAYYKDFFCFLFFFFLVGNSILDVYLKLLIELKFLRIRQHKIICRLKFFQVCVLFFKHLKTIYETAVFSVFNKLNENRIQNVTAY